MVFCTSLAEIAAVLKVNETSKVQTAVPLEGNMQIVRKHVDI